MSKKNSNRNLIIGIGVIAALIYFAGSKAKQVLGGLEFGRPSIKNFSIFYSNTLYAIASKADFTATLKIIKDDIKSQISFANILALIAGNYEAPALNFRFKVDQPVTNPSNLDIPNNNISGNVFLDGSQIGAFSYANTDFPANSTTVLKTDVNTTIGGLANVVKEILQNKLGIVSKGADIVMNVQSGGLNKTFTTNVPFV